MATSEHKPVLIVIAGPNGSGKTPETSKARLLFRLSDGELAKRYVDELPNWASTILPERKATK